MLRTLLQTRFGLVVRVEQKPVAGFALVQSKEAVKMPEVPPVNELRKDFEGAPQDRVTETLTGPVRTMMIPLGMRTVTSDSLYSTWTSAQGTFHDDATDNRAQRDVSC